MYVCMHVYVYMYMCIYVYIYTYVCIYVWKELLTLRDHCIKVCLCTFNSENVWVKSAGTLGDFYIS